jgi:hypothetical protein
MAGEDAEDSQAHGLTACEGYRFLVAHFLGGHVSSLEVG